MGALHLVLTTKLGRFCGRAFAQCMKLSCQRVPVFLRQQPLAISFSDPQAQVEGISKGLVLGCPSLDNLLAETLARQAHTCWLLNLSQRSKPRVVIGKLPGGGRPHHLEKQRGKFVGIHAAVVGQPGREQVGGVAAQCMEVRALQRGLPSSSAGLKAATLANASAGGRASGRFRIAP